MNDLFSYSVEDSADESLLNVLESSKFGVDFVDSVEPVVDISVVVVAVVDVVVVECSQICLSSNNIVNAVLHFPPKLSDVVVLLVVVDDVGDV